MSSRGKPTREHMFCVLLQEMVQGQVGKGRCDQLFWAWGLERLLEKSVLELNLDI